MSDHPEWTDAPTALTRQCVFLNIVGQTGTGRTTLALSAPGPIALAHTAEKLEGLVQRIAKIKPVKLLDFGFVSTSTEKRTVALSADKVYTKLKRGLEDAMDRWARTIIIDTDTETWEIARLARFGELNPKGNRMDALYGPVNAEFRALFKRHRHQNRCHLIVISQCKDEYQDRLIDGKIRSIQTGRLKQVGFKEMPYMADLTVWTSRGPKGEFLATITKGWWNASVEGLELENTTFAQIVGLVTEQDENMWMR